MENEQPASPSRKPKCPRGWNPQSIRATIVTMALGLLAMRILEVLFFVGMAGSAVVVVISFIEDAQELFGED